ncbi:hypothetical protein PLEOSDRAFT_154732 [Pleurotus ostreatus PC15]|uniref:Uncharacterized protein n=2 Tax=Pleurotus TaxID=5320 RepID=A0A067NQ16_PLEO1|nr:hypothetical protein CCMSSC00406_0007626 [Pleurotus cornucopiae]KDQ30019.1 hypothetical protein PLEOSDRAFT_154732 [Pleurotus ostreatus PC15]
MAPKEKITPEQKTHLMAQMDDYLEAQKHGSFTKFWVRLYQGWFHRWPAKEDPSIVDEAERREVYALAIKEQESYLKTWFRYRTAPKVRTSHAAAQAPVAVELPKATRCHQEVEVYSNKYYASRVAPHVQAYYKDKPEPSADERLKMIRKITKETLASETPEIKDEIKELYLKERLATKEEKLVRTQKADPTPESYIAGIKSIEPRFDAFAQGLAQDSGWTFLLIAGGPDPSNGGRINTKSYQYGTNVFGLTFSSQEPEFKTACIPAFTKYLYSCYSPEQCAARFNRLGETSPPISGELPIQAASPSPPLPNTIPCSDTADSITKPAVAPAANVDAPSEGAGPPIPSSEDAPPTSPTKPAKRAQKATPGKSAKPNTSLSAEAAALVMPDPAFAATTNSAASVCVVPSFNAAFAVPDGSITDQNWTQMDTSGLAAATWGGTVIPLLPPDLDYLNDPANFPDQFPMVSNTPMPTTIPSNFVVPPLGPYLSLLDELGSPLPANLLGVPSQVGGYSATNAAGAVIKETTDTAGPTATTTPPSHVQGDNPMDAGAETTGPTTTAETTDQPIGNARKRGRRDETDPKFIIEGKRVRKRQIRTEVEAITARAAAEREKGQEVERQKQKED